MIDIYAEGVAHGNVARVLANDQTGVKRLRTFGTLRKDEWVQFDQAVLGVARSRLRVLGDLMEAGLVTNIPNAFGTTIVQWETVTDEGEANVSMDAITPGTNDRPEYTLNSIPIPIVHEDFFVTLRDLEASRRLGAPLDTTIAEMKTRRVMEKLNDMVFNGLTGFQFKASTVPGLLTQSDILTQTITSWTVSGKTGEQILADVLDAITSLQAQNYFGPFVMYISNAYWIALQNDFKTNSDRSILERLRDLPDLSVIRGDDNISADTVLMFQATKDVIDLLVGFEPRVVEWQTHGGMVSNFKIMSIIVPRVRSDGAGQTGILKMAL